MFKWDDKYSVGNDILDKQHKELFFIGNNIKDTLKDKSFDKYDKIMNLISELYDYTVYHFENEKVMMEGLNKSLSAKHLKEHEEFTYKLMELKSLDIDGNQDEVLINALDFVANWVVGHILDTDKEYIGIL